MTETLKNMILDLEATERISKEISKRIEDYQLVNGLYYHISELTKYEDKKVCSILLVEKIDDETLTTIEIYPNKTVKEMIMEWYCNGNNNYIGFLEMYYIDGKDCEYCGYYEDVIKKEMNKFKIIELNLSNLPVIDLQKGMPCHL